MRWKYRVSAIFNVFFFLRDQFQYEFLMMYFSAFGSAPYLAFVIVLLIRQDSSVICQRLWATSHYSCSMNYKNVCVLCRDWFGSGDVWFGFLGTWSCDVLWHRTSCNGKCKRLKYAYNWEKIFNFFPLLFIPWLMLCLKNFKGQIGTQ